MTIVRRMLGLVMAVLGIASGLAAIAAVYTRRRFVPIDDPASDEFRIGAVFGPLYFRSTAPALRAGTIECWYGGGIVDLRDAVLDPAGAHLTVRSVFGGGQIVVPASWAVTGAVRGLGGFQDRRPPVARQADAPRLTIEVTAVFGGFAVLSDVSEKDLEGLREAVAARRERSAGKAAVRLQP